MLEQRESGTAKGGEPPTLSKQPNPTSAARDTLMTAWTERILSCSQPRSGENRTSRTSSMQDRHLLAHAVFRCAADDLPQAAQTDGRTRMPVCAAALPTLHDTKCPAAWLPCRLISLVHASFTCILL